MRERPRSSIDLEEDRWYDQHPWKALWVVVRLPLAMLGVVVLGVWALIQLT